MASLRTRRRPLALVGALLVAVTVAVGGPNAGAAPTADPDRGAVADWSTVTGTDGRVYIADAQGRAMQFHGFNIKTSSPAEAVTEELLAANAARGMDHLRLGFFWQDLEPKQGQFDESFVDQLVTVLDRAEKYGILVIFDMHQDVYGEAFDSKGIPAWATRDDGLPYEAQSNWLLSYLQPAVQAAFEHLYEDADLRQAQIDAWLHVVERVKGHPALLGYDLLNEPFGKQRGGEDILTAAPRVEREQLTPMFQRLTDAISDVDPDHWVFFEPPNLASLGIATSLGEVRGPKVAIYPHMYDSAIEAATYSPDGTIQLDPTFFDKWANAISGYVKKYPMPMLVGEWGLAHPEIKGMDEFVARALQTLDRTTSGWSVFVGCLGSGYCTLDESGHARPAIGQIFQPYARAIAGRPIGTTWDGPARTLTVRFDDESRATGATQIYLDEAATFADGYRVETSDADGTWQQTTVRGILLVTTPRTGGRHAICVKPVSAPRGCTVSDDAPATPTTVPGLHVTIRPAPRPAPARPINSAPTYTG